LPLVDISAALSWRGVPHALRDRAARELRRYPGLTASLKRLLGKPPSREEDQAATPADSQRIRQTIVAEPRSVP
jgi:hypothetical protein